MNNTEHQPLIIMRAPNNHINVTTPGRASITVPLSNCTLKLDKSGDFTFTYGDSIQIAHLTPGEVNQFRAHGVTVDHSDC